MTAAAAAPGLAIAFVPRTIPLAACAALGTADVTTALLVALGWSELAASARGAVGLVALIGFFMIGPYSYLAGALALDLGGKRGSATAAGIIDGIGYLGGILAGDSFARVSVAFGWSGAFTVLAAVALVSGVPAALLLVEERRS